MKESEPTKRTRVVREPHRGAYDRDTCYAILDEGIAPIDNDTVDLRELMQHMHKGRYSLVPYQPQVSESRRAAAISFDWNPDVGSVISIGNWTPGLYEINVVELADRSTPLPTISLRVFLCSSNEYPVTSSSYQRIRALSDKWAEAARMNAEASKP